MIGEHRVSVASQVLGNPVQGVRYDPEPVIPEVEQLLVAGVVRREAVIPGVLPFSQDVAAVLPLGALHSSRLAKALEAFFPGHVVGTVKEVPLEEPFGILRRAGEQEHQW